MRKVALLVLDLLIALYITGCGAASDANQPVNSGSNSVANRPVPPADAPAPAPKQLISYAVADQKALPACDASSEAEIAYVAAEKALYACSAGGWAAIDLTGPQGPQGPKGEVTAQATPTPVVLGANEFIDTSTGFIWTKSTVLVLFADAKKVCATVGRRLPTEDEASAAVILGTVKNLPMAGFGIWADTGREATPGLPGVMMDVDPTDKGYAYCVKNP